jgi:hypothetical protein
MKASIQMENVKHYNFTKSATFGFSVNMSRRVYPPPLKKIFSLSNGVLMFAPHTCIFSTISRLFFALNFSFLPSVSFHISPLSKICPQMTLAGTTPIPVEGRGLFHYLGPFLSAKIIQAFYSNDSVLFAGCLRQNVSGAG